ncbi:MAG: WD40/YVTN/BNR-like repeat-containing protein, partial [Planctomycetaceae bacterium]
MLAGWWMGVVACPAWAQEAPPSPPAVWQEDATLHAVCLAGEMGAFAVGDHGTIWASTDGGRTWRAQRSGVSAPLYDVFFLSRREGWAVGGETEPYTLRPRGVVLHTRDAGATWEVLQPAASVPAVLDDSSTESETPRLDSGRRERQPESGEGNALPRLRRVRFFTPLLGLAAGAAPQSGEGGLFRTTDGGRTWEPLPSDNPTEWLAADFANLETGALAGLRGETTRLREGTLEPGRNPPLGLRGVYDLSLADGRGGWLAGDGGLLLATTNGGLVWQAPEANLPDGVPALFDFRAVASRGPKVWVAGTPGSVIWHSADFGESWTAQPTGQPLPLVGLAMDENGRGCAVGALGVIVQTSDGGERWEVVRGERRRAALWQLVGRASDTRLAVPVDYAGEQGFRTVLEALAREDLPQATRSAADWPLRLAEAIPRAGGAMAETAWQFPLAVPGLERDSEALWAEWNRRNE